jgi:hypothetical protein
MMGNDEIARVKESYQRCLESQEFFDVFYKNFTAKGPHIVDKFKDTDMKRQMDALKHGLQYMIMYAEGSKIASAKIEDLGTTHDRKHRDITEGMYMDWTRSLVETIAKFDPQFNQDLARDWENVLSHGIRRIKAMY